MSNLRTLQSENRVEVQKENNLQFKGKWNFFPRILFMFFYSVDNHALYLTITWHKTKIEIAHSDIRNKENLD